jgi:hypothetical protein
MTCFIAHMDKKGYFEEIGVKVTKENAKAIEGAIAKVVGRPGEHCPAIWQETKKWLADPKKKAVLDRELKAAFGKKGRK